MAGQNKMIIYLPIQVSDNDYCCKYDPIKGYSLTENNCDHFNNFSGEPMCMLNIGTLKYNEFGDVLKPNACLKLNDLTHC